MITKSYTPTIAAVLLSLTLTFVCCSAQNCNPEDDPPEFKAVNFGVRFLNKFAQNYTKQFLNPNSFKSIIEDVLALSIFTGKLTSQNIEDEVLKFLVANTVNILSTKLKITNPEDIAVLLKVRNSTLQLKRTMRIYYQLCKINYCDWFKQRREHFTSDVVATIEQHNSC